MVLGWKLWLESLIILRSIFWLSIFEFSRCGTFRELFFRDELKHRIWDCDNFKSHEPYKVNFGFVIFCPGVNSDFMRFLL
jgi:hypothetical protein